MGESNWNTLYIDIALICWTFVGMGRWIYKRYCQKEKPLEKAESEMLQLQTNPNNQSNIVPVQPIQMQVQEQQPMAQGYNNGNMYAQPSAPPQQDAAYQNALVTFGNLDTNNDGFINYQEFQGGIGGFGQNEEDVRRRFMQLDTNGDGFLSFEEFKQ